MEQVRPASQMINHYHIFKPIQAIVMNDKEPVSNETKTRRTLVMGIGLMSVFSFFTLGLFSKKRNIIACAPPEEKKTMKFLDQNGQLVEVDISKISNSAKEKASNKELQEWVKR